MKRYHFISTLLLTGCFAGCNPEAVPSTPTDESGLEVHANVGSYADTRSAIVEGSVFNHEARIKVIAVNSSGSSSSKSTADYICKNPSGNAPAWVALKAPIQLSATGVRVLACYPSTLPDGQITLVGSHWNLDPDMATTLDYGDLYTSYNGSNSFYSTFNGTLTVAEEVFMAGGEKDYMTGFDTPGEMRTSSNKEASLTMRHCMSLLVFHCYKSATNTNPGKVTRIIVKNGDPSGGPLRKGTFQLEDNAFIPGNRIDYVRTMTHFPADSYYGMLVYPTETFTDAAVQAEFEVDSIAYSLNLPAHRWKSGYITLYNIELKPTRAQLMDIVQLVEWPDIEQSDDHPFEIE